MMKVTYKSVKSQAAAWETSYTQNNERGKTCMLFGLAGEQWEQSVISKRKIKNKESLTFNLCLKHLRRMKAQGREIEFSLNMSPTNNIYEDNTEETNTFRLILRSILLNNDMVSKFSDALNQCVEYGYSFVEINFDRENQDTLNYIPVLRLHKECAIAFWDKNAISAMKVDGRFCGMRRKMSKQEILRIDPTLKSKTFINENENEIIDYWYRDYEPVKYIRLTTGIFKREDLLTDDDNQHIATPEDVADEEDKELIKNGTKECIYFMRFCNEQVIIPARLFPTDDLPLIKHPALTTYIPEHGEMTFPLIYPWIGAQKLHNFVHSQSATNAKNSSGDKWFFNQSHVLTQDQQNTAKQINTLEGGMIFGGDTQTIRREMPAELPRSMLELAQQTKQEIDEMAGAMMDAKNSAQVVASGVALDKITHNMGVVNEDILATHVLFVNQIGKTLRQMIPRILTEERTIVITKEDGSNQTIVINQDVGTGTIRNNIKDINNNFYYEITAGPSSAMQKENTINYLNTYYQINPQAAALTGDVYMRNLDTPESGILEKRMAVGIDPNLIKYSQGEISREEYQKLTEEAQQKQIQQQLQIAMANPQFQSMMQLAQAEMAKSQAAQFDSQTKRISAIADIQNSQQQLQIKLLDTLSKDDREIRQQDIDEIRAQLEFNQQLIDGMKNASTNETAASSR